MPHNICITSCDGQTGHLVAELLLSDQFSDKLGGPLACLSFDKSRTEDLETAGATVAVVDLQKGSSKSKRSTAMVDALKKGKIDTIMVIPPARENKVDLTKEMVEAAKKAGVQNVLLLSSAGCDMAERDEQPLMRMFIDIEQMVMEAKGDPDVPTGHSPCVIRAGFYAENLLLYGKQAKEQGILGLPIGPNHKCAPVALGDIALLAATVLVGEGEHGFDDAHRGQLMVATGPMLAAGEELVTAAEEAIGVKLEFKDIKPEEAKKLLSSETDLDPSEIDYLLEFYSLVKAGKTNYVSTVAFEAVTGQKPQELTEFFETYIDDFTNSAATNGKKRSAKAPAKKEAPKSKKQKTEKKGKASKKGEEEEEFDGEEEEEVDDEEVEDEE
ncbi:hypothetical protein HKX48_004638 [Thoreauomyces humboldtii]|nr:hypothetical protein HKX48_004638 [Thoreauomyces humboldtii]